MSYHFYDFVGNLGVILILVSYFLLQLGKMSSTGLSYTLFNILGAALVLYSLFYDFNLSAFIIEVFWLLFSFIGLARIYMARRREQAHQ